MLALALPLAHAYVGKCVQTRTHTYIQADTTCMRTAQSCLGFWLRLRLRLRRWLWLRFRIENFVEWVSFCCRCFCCCTANWVNKCKIYGLSFLNTTLCLLLLLLLLILFEPNAFAALLFLQSLLLLLRVLRVAVAVCRCFLLLYFLLFTWICAHFVS